VPATAIGVSVALSETQPAFFLDARRGSAQPPPRRGVLGSSR